MTNKGYDHPLYSMDLLGPDEEPPDEARYCILVPQGRLVVRPELRRRAEDVATAACEGAVCDALARHATSRGEFASHGLDEAWAGNLRYWDGQARDLECERIRHDLLIKEQVTLQCLLVRHGRKLWGRISLAARMAGIGGTITTGEPPRAIVLFTDALCQAARLAEEPGRLALLQAHGFTTRYQTELREVVTQLPQVRQRILDLQRIRQEIGDRILVMRGAVLGDLSRLVQTAPYVLAEEHLHAVRLARLFPRRRRRVPAAA